MNNFYKIMASLLWVVISFVTANAQNNDPELQKALEEIDPKVAIEFDADDLEAISEVDAFCFDHEEEMIILFGKDFGDDGWTVWGPGYWYSFLSEIKKETITIEPVKFTPHVSSVTVFTPEWGEVEVSAKAQFFYKVKQTE